MLQSVPLLLAGRIGVSDLPLQQAILSEVAPQGRGVKRLLDPVAEQQVAHLFRRQQMNRQILRRFDTEAFVGNVFLR